MPTSLEHSPLAELNNQFRTNKAFHAAIALFVLSAFLEAGIVLLPSAVPDISPMLSGALFVCGHCLGLVIVTVTWRPTGTIQGLWEHILCARPANQKDPDPDGCGPICVWVHINIGDTIRANNHRSHFGRLSHRLVVMVTPR